MKKIDVYILKNIPVSPFVPSPFNTWRFWAYNFTKKISPKCEGISQWLKTDNLTYYVNSGIALWYSIKYLKYTYTYVYVYNRKN